MLILVASVVSCFLRVLVVAAVDVGRREQQEPFLVGAVLLTLVVLLLVLLTLHNSHLP